MPQRKGEGVTEGAGAGRQDRKLHKGNVTGLGALSWASRWNSQVRAPGDGLDATSMGPSNRKSDRGTE